MVHKFFIGLVFVISSIIFDNLTTFFAIKKGGSRAETNFFIRKQIKNKKIKKALLLISLRQIVAIISLGIVAFGVDSLFKIQVSKVNFHLIVLFGYGIVRFLAGFSNVFAEIAKLSSDKNLKFLENVFLYAGIAVRLPLLVLIKITSKNKYDRRLFGR